MAAATQRFRDPGEVSAELETARKIKEEFASRGLTDERAPGYFIRTFGCQQNEADSERLAGLCEAMGYSPVPVPDGVLPASRIHALSALAAGIISSSGAIGCVWS